MLQQTCSSLFVATETCGYSSASFGCQGIIDIAIFLPIAGPTIILRGVDHGSAMLIIGAGFDWSALRVLVRKDRHPSIPMRAYSGCKGQGDFKARCPLLSETNLTMIRVPQVRWWGSNRQLLFRCRFSTCEPILCDIATNAVISAISTRIFQFRPPWGIRVHSVFFQLFWKKPRASQGSEYI